MQYKRSMVKLLTGPFLITIFAYLYAMASKSSSSTLVSNSKDPEVSFDAKMITQTRRNR